MVSVLEKINSQVDLDGEAQINWILLEDLFRGSVVSVLQDMDSQVDFYRGAQVNFYRGAQVYFVGGSTPMLSGVCPRGHGFSTSIIIGG